MITASYLLGREQKYTAGSVSSEGDSILYSGISAVKSGSHVLKLYGDLSVLPDVHGGWLLAILNIFSVVIIRTQKHTDRQTVENTVWIAL